MHGNYFKKRLKLCCMCRHNYVAYWLKYKSHLNRTIMHFDIISLACRSKKYANIIKIWNYTFQKWYFIDIMSIKRYSLEYSIWEGWIFIYYSDFMHIFKMVNFILFIIALMNSKSFKQQSLFEVWFKSILHKEL